MSVTGFWTESDGKCIPGPETVKCRERKGQTMVFSIMKENGLAELPGGVNRELLCRIDALERAKLDSNRVTRSGAVTGPGFAVDARELNAGMEGTLANRTDSAWRKTETVQVPFELNTNALDHQGFFVYRTGKMMTVWIHVVPAVAADDLYIAKIRGVTPAFPTNSFRADNPDYNFYFSSDGSGDTDVRLGAEQAGGHAVLSGRCILLQ